VEQEPERIVLFDGVCSVCDHGVHFILDRDSRRRFQFAALQSPAGQALLERFGIPNRLETMVLIEGGAVYTASTAVLRVARKLDGAWPVFYVLRFVPRRLRDLLYRFFVAHRYQWFGQLDACRIPTPELRSRFLDLPNQPSS
jgi:predicted DCC family thiol-disulfide oxidoreductase YuxK